MTNSAPYSTPHPPRPRPAAYVLLIASFAGFSDSAYLTAKFLVGTAPTCVLLRGCDIVTLSRYATIFNIPIALIGAVYYLAVFVLIISFLNTRRPGFLYAAAAVPLPAALFSVWLIYLQIAVIKALCVFCLFSAITTGVLLCAGLSVLIKRRTLDGVVYEDHTR